MWILIAATVLATLAAVVVYANLKPAEAVISEVPRVRHAIRDPRFLRDLDATFSKPIVAGNRIETLNNGVEIFPAMLDAIRGARHSITFETYVFWRGAIVDEFAAALAERARAGVAVHVILDWAGMQAAEPEPIELMRGAGVEVECYRPLSWYHVDRLNNRTHRKILVVDGRVAFTGGAGIAEEWTGDAGDADHYRDTHYRVTGPVVAQLQTAFLANWSKSSGRLLQGEAYFPELEPAGDSAAQVVTSTPGVSGESARALFLLAIAAARESLTIGSPYFVPDDLVTRALHEAAERGVAITVLVPGRQTDSDLTRHASRAKWGPLLERGVRIHEYGGTLYHVKLLVVDGFWTIVGSTNFDIRSLRLNDEINLNVFDEAFAASQVAMFERDLERAREIDYQRWARRPLSERLLEPFALLLQSQL